VEKHKETLKAIAFILLVLGAVAFVEWVILKDYEPTPNTGWSRGE
jgi:Na+-translocating ferredoxin:NAD+ oxidoreductase RnfA subunit